MVVALASAKKNLIKSRDEYTRYYGDFRGVDFSSDHTQVHPQRLAYLVNMYKDYRSGEGSSLETIPGFRRAAEMPTKDGEKVLNKQINALHEFSYVENNKRHSEVLIHAGRYIYKWGNFPQTADVELSIWLPVTDNKALLPEEFPSEKIESITTEDGSKLTKGFSSSEDNTYLVLDDKITWGKFVTAHYREGFFDIKDDTITKSATNAPSVSFSFNNSLYMLCGNQISRVWRKKFGKGEGATWSTVWEEIWENAHIPTIYADIDVSDVSDISKYQYEQLNLLSDTFKQTYIGDGETTTYYLHRSGTAQKVVVDGKVLAKNKDYTIIDNTVTFADGKALAEDKDYTVSGDGTIKLTNGTALAENKDYTVIGNTVTLTDGKVLVENEDYKVIGNTIKLTDGTVLVENEDYTANGNTIMLTLAPAESAKVEITAVRDQREYEDGRDKILRCTIATVFDKRVFLSGNPMYPNHIFFCGINRETGYEDPTYFGELDFVVDGVEAAPITALIPVADTLAALKNHAKQDGSVYFHSRLETTKNYAPVTYPSVQGLSGVGCLGAALNFRDDPVFISQFGVEGIGQLSVRLERAIEHRSTLIDAKLCNLDLGKAKLCEFDGYLVVLCDGGKMFLGDSRQAYGDGSGTKQYEWYYCEGIGVYEDSKKDNLNRVIKEYYFSANVPNDFKPVKDKSGVKHNVYTAKDIYDDLREINTDLTNSAVPASFEPIETIDVDDTYRVVLYYTLEGEELKTKAYLTEHRGSYTGGVFHPATTIANINGNLYFGTDNGVVCAFNFDKRASDGLIPSTWYSFDDRTIYSGCATKMDNCDVPHLAKSTIKKSTVIKTRALLSAAVKVKVRTDKKTYERVGRYSTRILDFSDMNFSDLDFTVTEQTIHAAKEQEKHWVEKQYLLYTDEYQKPLSLQYIAYRYKIAGRVKG